MPDFSKILILTGLIFGVLGSVVIIYPAAKEFFHSLFSPAARKKIEDEAIATTFNRLGSSDRERTLSDPYVQRFMANYRRSLVGFIFLILGFPLQLIGTIMQKSGG